MPGPEGRSSLLAAIIRVVKNRQAFETAYLVCGLAVFGSDVIDETLMSTDHSCVVDASSFFGVLNYRSCYGWLHIHRVVRFWDVFRVFHRGPPARDHVTFNQRFVRVGLNNLSALVCIAAARCCGKTYTTRVIGLFPVDPASLHGHLDLPRQGQRLGAPNSKSSLGRVLGFLPSGTRALLLQHGSDLTLRAADDHGSHPCA